MVNKETSQWFHSINLSFFYQSYSINLSFYCHFWSCFVPCLGVFLVGSERVYTCWSGSMKSNVLVKMCLMPIKNVLLQQSAYYLKFLSSIFLLLCSISMKEGTCESRKKILFHVKGSFRFWDIQILQFYNPQFPDVIKRLSKK